MPSEAFEEIFVQDRFVLIEHVPARVCVQPGERFFSPETVERLQRIIWEEHVPSRIIEPPVCGFAEWGPDSRASPAVSTRRRMRAAITPLRRWERQAPSGPKARLCEDWAPKIDLKGRKS